MSSGHSISVVEARKNYGSLSALRDLSIEIKPEKFTVLLGPSGSGKSTLLRSIAGIEKIDSGHIYLSDKEVNRGPINVAPEKRNLAMVFQDYALWPHLTAAENVEYALKRRKIDKTKLQKSALKMLERVGLAEKGGNYPHQLSGGEQQRVALARAIVAEPALLLFDEPLSNLDADLRERLRIEIATLTRECGATALYITHDQAEAFALADKIGVLRSGGLEQYDSPEKIYFAPATQFVARFTGLGGSFIGVVEESDKSTAVVNLGGELLSGQIFERIKPGSEVVVMIRPTATKLAPAERGKHRFGAATNVLSGKVLDSAYRGKGYEHLVETKYGSISSVFDTEQWRRGSNCSIEIDSKACMIYPSGK
jgi:ABC-type Fe3+/spermidine/putrescine transport system ATPase subunit